MLRSTRSRAVVALAGSAIAAAGMVAPVSAHAATARNGVCEAGEFCFSFNSGFQGSVSDFTSGLGAYGTKQPGCYEFRTPTSWEHGYQRCMEHETASVYNRMKWPVRVYTGAGFTGRSMVIRPGVKTTLPAGFKNNVRSHLIEGVVKPCLPGRPC